jgi:S-adenosylmethionine-diacylglycerol 3-amino-3-carboxypropyl transferase
MDLVYNQTWEDPQVDFEALQISSRDVVVMVTSGGCNVLNCSLVSPAKIFSVDHNPTQNDLLRVKIKSIVSGSHANFFKRFGEGDLYTQGKLGFFRVLRIWMLAFVSRSTWQEFLSITDLNKQSKFYSQKILSRLWNPVTKYIPVFTMWFYGVSLRQIVRSLQQGQIFLKDIYYDQINNLFTHVHISDNYFWQRIIQGRYPGFNCCPDYLKPQNYNQLKKQVKKITIVDSGLITFLKSQPVKSIDKFNLSDIPEFLSVANAHGLFQEVLRTGKNNSRIVFRSFTPGLGIEGKLAKYFIYETALSNLLTISERTASYGQVYVYHLKK